MPAYIPMRTKLSAMLTGYSKIRLVAPDSIRTIKAIILYCSKVAHASFAFSGKKYTMILAPSRGGIGIILNMARSTFTVIILSSSNSYGPGIGNMNSRASRKARRRFDAGPARLTIRSSRRRFLKFEGLLGPVSPIRTRPIETLACR